MEKQNNNICQLLGFLLTYLLTYDKSPEVTGLFGVLKTISTDRKIVDKELIQK